MGRLGIGHEGDKRSGDGGERGKGEEEQRVRMGVEGGGMSLDGRKGRERRGEGGKETGGMERWNRGEGPREYKAGGILGGRDGEGSIRFH